MKTVLVNVGDVIHVKPLSEVYMLQHDMWLRRLTDELSYSIAIHYSCNYSAICRCASGSQIIAESHIYLIYLRKSLLKITSLFKRSFYQIFNKACSLRCSFYRVGLI
jgi:hypothetical protein